MEASKPLKKLFNDFKNKLKRQNFNRKINYFLITEILVITLVFLIITVVSNWISVRNKTTDLAMKQINLVSNTLESTLKGFEDDVELLMFDSRIQEYLKSPGNSISTTNAAYNSLNYMMNAKTDISYMAVINTGSNGMIYTGTPVMGSNFIEQARNDFKSAVKTSYSNMRTNVSHKIFYPNEYSLNVYQPLYDEYEINKELGLLCISMDESVLCNSYSVKSTEMPFDVYLADNKGNIISNQDKKLISTKSPYAADFVGNKGYFEKNGNLVVYQYIGSWNWYVVGTIKSQYLYSDIYLTILILLALVTAFCLISVLISIKLSNSLYKPMKDIVRKMEIVSGGSLEVKMDPNYSGDDFRQLASGFNEMIDEIQNLMVRVKTEQHQIEQIKLNALQAQIKPHFLYNTLDCIHWQALSDGNDKISKMVKALAKYYRLCLSSGHDIIPLSNEIEHISSYLIIQNMRYGDIIKSVNDIDECYYNVRIPKMTLQPLVENCINHGINVKEGHKGTIILKAKEADGCVIVSVEDSGTGMAQEKIDEINHSLSDYEETLGYGVQNVHKRIQLLFGEQYGLHYRQNDLGGITVEIRLPKQISEVE